MPLLAPQILAMPLVSINICLSLHVNDGCLWWMSYSAAEWRAVWQALKRPGRLDREIYVGLPDEVARREIFEILFRKTPVADNVDIDQLVQRTHRYSGAEAS